jgi:hypothetical protein
MSSLTATGNVGDFGDLRSSGLKVLDKFERPFCRRGEGPPASDMYEPFHVERLSVRKVCGADDVRARVYESSGGVESDGAWVNELERGSAGAGWGATSDMGRIRVGDGEGACVYKLERGNASAGEDAASDMGRVRRLGEVGI